MAEYDLRRAMVALLPELRAYARFLSRTVGEADDLVQEAVVRALGASHQFQVGTSLRAWLFTILRNAFYEQARRRRTESAAISAADQPPVSTIASQQDHVDVADLQLILFRLSPLLREALLLVGAQGLSYEEAAQICDVPTGTMKARVSRARAALSREMGDRAPAA